MLVSVLACMAAFAPLLTRVPLRHGRRIAVSMDGQARIEFQPDVPEPCVPSVSCWPTRNLTIASFTFTNPLTYPEDLLRFGVFAKEDFLLQIDLENVGKREQIEQIPTLHAVCAAAGVELRIYATSDDSRAKYATHVVT